MKKTLLIQNIIIEIKRMKTSVSKGEKLCKAIVKGRKHQSKNILKKLNRLILVDTLPKTIV
jgi:hypothetical protein